MAIKPISQETMAQTQSELKSEFASAFQTPRVENTTNVLLLGVDQRFSYAGKVYFVPPVGFRLGATLQKVVIQIKEIRDMLVDSEAVNDAYITLCEDAAHLIWSHVYPLSLKQLILKKLRMGANPFLKATDGEVAQLLDFFSRLRTLSRLEKK